MAMELNGTSGVRYVLAEHSAPGWEPDGTRSEGQPTRPLEDTSLALLARSLTIKREEWKRS